MTDLPFQDRLQFDRLWRNGWRFLSSARLAAGLLLALALCAALGTLLPQQPTQADLPTWMGMVRQRYGGRASLYASLGLFHIYHTPLFIALVSALVANTLACTIRRAISIWRATHRAPRVIQSDAFYRLLQCHAPFSLSSIPQGLETARSTLSHRRYHIVAARRGGVDYLYGERHRWSRWATLITHGAVILLITTLLLRGSLAWQELRVQLAPHQAYPVGHHTPWEVRFDRFSGRALGDGQSVEYQAHLTLLAQGKPVTEHWVRVNSPLLYGGLRVYLFAFGPAVGVRAESQGQPVPLKPLLEGEVEGEGAVFLPFSKDCQSQVLLIPSRNLRLHFSPQVAAGGLFIELTQGEEGRLVWSGSLPASGRLEVGALLIEVRRKTFVVVDIVHDPSFLPVIVSAALMVAGLSCTFAFPTRQLWIQVAPGEMWIAGRASRDPIGFEHHFRRLAQELEVRLAGGGKEAGDG